MVVGHYFSCNKYLKDFQGSIVDTRWLTWHRYIPFCQPFNASHLHRNLIKHNLKEFSYCCCCSCICNTSNCCCFCSCWLQGFETLATQVPNANVHSMLQKWHNVGINTIRPTPRHSHFDTHIHTYIYAHTYIEKM